MFNSGFLLQFEEKDSTLPCCLCPIPGLSASSVWADARSSEAGSPSQAGQERLQGRIQKRGTSRSTGPTTEPGLADPGTECREWRVRESSRTGLSHCPTQQAVMSSAITEPQLLLFLFFQWPHHPSITLARGRIGERALEICIGFVSSVCM